MSGCYFSVYTGGHLVEFDLGQRIDDLTDDVITGESIVAENDEMKGYGRQKVTVDSEEREHLLEDWIQSFT